MTHSPYLPYWVCAHSPHPNRRTNPALIQALVPRVLVGALLSAGLGHAQAQTPPDAGSVLRELERQQRQGATTPAAPGPARPAAPSTAPAPQSAETAEVETRFVVKSFALAGITLVPEPAVQAVLSPWLNRPINFAELEQALQAVAVFYQGQGWLARAQLPEQTLDERAEVRVQVLEARIGQAQLARSSAAPEDQGKSRLPTEHLQRLLQAQLPAGRPLRLPDYERALSLVSETPGVSASASLAASDTPGATDIVVAVQDRGWGSAAVVYDNGGSRSTGADRLNAQLSLDNPLRLGDQLLLNLMATEGVDYQRLAYHRPLGLQGWRVGVNAAQMRYRLLGAFTTSDSYGDTQVFGTSALWPWLRGSQGQATFSLQAERKQFHNVVTGLSDARKTLHSVQASLNGDRADSLGDGGSTSWGLNLTAGRLALKTEADRQQDSTGPQTEGGFGKVTASVARLQRWGGSHALWLSWNGQRATRNLDSSEKFSLGGPQGVRAYPASEATGDHGWLATAEWRYSLSAQWQWSGFYDHGQVRVQHRPYGQSASPPQLALRGYGMGLAWTPAARGAVRLTLARRAGTNPLANTTTGADSDGSLRRNRLWLTATLNL